MAEADRKDFFISYAGANRAWAEWIAWQLEQVGGYTVILQAWDFAAGENFIQRMNEALDQSDRVISVLSQAYLASRYCREEWTAAMLDGGQQRGRLFPIRVEECDLPPLLATRIYSDLVELGPAEAQRTLLDAIKGPTHDAPHIYSVQQDR